MAKDKKKALPEGEESEAPVKKSKKKLIIIIIVLLLMLSGVGAGVYWWFFLRAPAVAQDGESEAVATLTAEEQKASDSKQEKTASPEKDDKTISQAKVERPASLPRSQGGIVVPLSPVTVNLLDAGGRRYLKLGMEVEVNKDVSKALKTNEARIRDAVIMLLAGKSYAEVASPDGKVMLKAEVANRLNQILGEQRVIRVYFTDFVVQ